MAESLTARIAHKHNVYIAQTRSHILAFHISNARILTIYCCAGCSETEPNNENHFSTIVFGFSSVLRAAGKGTHRGRGRVPVLFSKCAQLLNPQCVCVFFFCFVWKVSYVWAAVCRVYRWYSVVRAKTLSSSMYTDSVVELYLIEFIL